MGSGAEFVGVEALSIFEFVFALYSVIGSLAIAHLLAGIAGLIRNRQRVKVSIVHALWMWGAFAITIGNWASQWSLHAMDAWPGWSVLVKVATVVVTYLACYLVTPDIPSEGEINLKDFHTRERVGYISAFGGIGLISILSNLTFGAANYFDEWLRDSALSLVALCLMLLALLVRASWAQIIAAVGTAALATYFLVVASSIGTG